MEEELKTGILNRFGITEEELFSSVEYGYRAFEEGLISYDKAINLGLLPEKDVIEKIGVEKAITEGVLSKAEAIKWQKEYLYIGFRYPNELIQQIQHIQEEEYTIKEIPNCDKEKIINTINTNQTKYNSFIIETIHLLKKGINQLKKESILPYNDIEYIADVRYIAMANILLIKHEEGRFKNNTKELKSINNNSKSVLNTISDYMELQINTLKRLDPTKKITIIQEF